VVGKFPKRMWFTRLIKHMNTYQDKIGHFPRQLEDESIYIMREVAAPKKHFSQVKFLFH
jgi:hypothetical protein